MSTACMMSTAKQGTVFLGMTGRRGRIRDGVACGARDPVLPLMAQFQASGWSVNPRELTQSKRKGY